LQGGKWLAPSGLQKAIDLGNDNYLWFEADPNLD